jgi:hypothetical protein
MMRKQDVSHGGMRGTSLECQDLVIPLATSVTHLRHPDYVAAAAPSVQPIILLALREAAHEGWKEDQPTDFATLFSRAQVRTITSVLRWRVSSVTIRLTRVVRGVQLVPHG